MPLTRAQWRVPAKPGTGGGGAAVSFAKLVKREETSWAGQTRVVWELGGASQQNGKAVALPRTAHGAR